MGFDCWREYQLCGGKVLSKGRRYKGLSEYAEGPTAYERPANMTDQVYNLVMHSCSFAPGERPTMHVVAAALLQILET